MSNSAKCNAQQYMSQLQATCDTYGYQRGTNAYAQCVQGLQQNNVKAAAYNERCKSFSSFGREIGAALAEDTSIATQQRLRGC